MKPTKNAKIDNDRLFFNQLKKQNARKYFDLRAIRAQIEHDTREFLAKGNRINVVPGTPERPEFVRYAAR